MNMKDLVYKDHTALDYAKMACDTLMKKFDAPDLPPKGRFHYHQGVFLSGRRPMISARKKSIMIILRHG